MKDINEDFRWLAIRKICNTGPDEIRFNIFGGRKRAIYMRIKDMYENE